MKLVSIFLIFSSRGFLCFFCCRYVVFKDYKNRNMLRYTIHDLQSIDPHVYLWVPLRSALKCTRPWGVVVNELIEHVEAGVQGWDLGASKALACPCIRQFLVESLEKR